MTVKYETKVSIPNKRVWIGKFINLHNLPHWHWEYELISCQSGTALLIINGREYHLKAGDIALCPSGYAHYISACDKSLIIIAKFDGTLAKDILKKYQLKNLCFTDTYQINSRLEVIYNEFKTKRKFYNDLAESLIIQIIVDIFRKEETKPFEVETPQALVHYKFLLDEINEKYEFLTFQEAANAMHMTEAYFSRYFKKLSGMTFSTYLNMIKIEHAISLLHESPDISTSDLMLKCGFNTLRHFNRTFKTVTGYSPSNLPPDFTLNLKTGSDSDGFDPTLPSTIIV